MKILVFLSYTARTFLYRLAFFFFGGILLYQKFLYPLAIFISCVMVITVGTFWILLDQIFNLEYKKKNKTKQITCFLEHDIIY